MARRSKSSCDHLPRQSAIHSQEQLISKFRFSLISLAIVVIPIAWLSLYIQRQLNTPEIQFREFTWAKMEKEVSHGKTVLMYCTMYKDLIPHQFSNKTLRRSYHEGNFIAMKLTYSDWSEPEINNIFKQVGHTKYPMTILFKPNEWPARIDSVSAEQWLELGLIRPPSA